MKSVFSDAFKNYFLPVSLCLFLGFTACTKGGDSENDDSGQLQTQAPSKTDPNIDGPKDVSLGDDSTSELSGIEWTATESRNLTATRLKAYTRPSQSPFFVQSEDKTLDWPAPSFLLSADNKLVEAEVKSGLSHDESLIAFLTINGQYQRTLHIRDIKTGNVTSWDIEWPNNQECSNCNSPEYTQLSFTQDLKRIVIRMGGQVQSDTYESTFLAFDRLSPKMAWKTVKQSVRPNVHLHNLQHVVGTGRDHLFLTTSESTTPSQISLHALDLHSGELKLVSPDIEGLQAVQISGDGRKVAVPRKDSLEIFDSESLSRISEMVCADCGSITLSPDFSYYLKSSFSGPSSTEARELSTGKLLWKLTGESAGVVDSDRSISRNGKYIALKKDRSVDGYNRSTVSILNGTTGKVIGAFKEPDKSYSGPLTRRILYISDDGKTIVSSYNEGIKYFGIEVFKPLPADKPCVFNSLKEKTSALNQYFKVIYQESKGLCKTSEKYADGMSDDKSEVWDGNFSIRFSYNENEAGPFLTDSGKIGINCGNGVSVPVAGSIDLMCNSYGLISSVDGHYSNTKCNIADESAYEFSTSRRDGKKPFYKSSSKKSYPSGKYVAVEKSCQSD